MRFQQRSFGIFIRIFKKYITDRIEYYRLKVLKKEVKKGQDKNPARFKIQYPMKTISIISIYVPTYFL